MRERERERDWLMERSKTKRRREKKKKEKKKGKDWQWFQGLVRPVALETKGHKKQPLLKEGYEGIDDDNFIWLILF